MAPRRVDQDRRGYVAFALVEAFSKLVEHPLQKNHVGVEHTEECARGALECGVVVAGKTARAGIAEGHK